MPLDDTKTEATVAVKAPAMVFTLTTNLGDARQLTVSTNVLATDDLATVHAMLDKMGSAGDRQKAKYEIQNLRDKLEIEQATLAKQRDNMAHLDADHDRKVADLNVQIETLREDAKAIEDAAYQAHGASGRRGAFKLQGSDQSRVAGLKAQIAQIATEIGKAKAEREQAHANAAINDAAFEKSLARLRAEIASREAIVGG